VLKIAQYKPDCVYIILLTIIYFSLSLTGISWDNLEMRNGYGQDPDGGVVPEALGYLHNPGATWNIGHKVYPQGYGIVLAGFYKLTLLVSSLFDHQPSR